MLLPKIKSTTPCILLANDDPDECRLFKNALETLNIPCNVSVIQNGAVLENLLNEQGFTPDFICWKLEVPSTSKVNGLQLIKKRKKLRSVPVIIFSKFANPHNKDYCYQSSSNEYFLRALSFLL